MGYMELFTEIFSSFLGILPDCFYDYLMGAIALFTTLYFLKKAFAFLPF